MKTLWKFIFFIRECLFYDDIEEDDVYVMRPFPSMWNCGVAHPHGLDPPSGDVKTMQGFSRSLEILIHMRSESYRLGLISGKYLAFIFFFSQECELGSSEEDKIFYKCILIIDLENLRCRQPVFRERNG